MPVNVPTQAEFDDLDEEVGVLALAVATLEGRLAALEAKEPPVEEPPPPSPPPPPPPPASTGFPSAETTGVRSGVVLSAKVASLNTTSHGQVIEKRSIGFLNVRHNNVVVRDCRIDSALVGNAQSNVVTGVVIEYCDIVGNNSLNSLDVEGDRTTIRFCDISGSENGIWLEADDCVIEDNYIHNLFSNTGSSDPHIDGIQVPGSNIGAIPTERAIIRRNKIDLDVSTATSCIITLDPAGFLIEKNFFSGGAYVVYLQQAKDCILRDNVFDKKAFGYLDLRNSTNLTITGNVTVNGEPVNG